MLAQLTATREHFIPELNALRFAKIKMSDGAEVTLEKLTARRNIQAFERVCKQLEIRVFNRQTRGRWGAGAGHIRFTPSIKPIPAGFGESTYGFLFL